MARLPKATDHSRRYIEGFENGKYIFGSDIGPTLQLLLAVSDWDIVEISRGASPRNIGDGA